MNFMPALRTHAYEQNLQAHADAVYAEQRKAPHETVTRERINTAINLLRPEQQHILNEYFGKLTPEQEQDAIDRLNDLCDMAEKTFAPILRSLEGAPKDEQLEAFEKQFFNWMALVMPSVGPKSSWLRKVEAETGIQNINHGDRIWTSQSVGRYMTSEEIEQNPTLKLDAQGWQETSGLLIHTAAAAWGIQRFVKIIQDNIRGMKESGIELNERQNNTLKLDPKIMRIWLLFHDALRTFSHDTFVHAAALPLFARLMNLPTEYLEDYDLPEIMGFMHTNPEKHNGAGNMPEGLPPFKVEGFMRDNPQLLMQNGNFYIEKVLELLEQKNLDNTPKEGVLFFWIIDAYSKLQPFTEMNSTTDAVPAHKSNFAFPSQSAIEKHFNTWLEQAREEEERTGVFPSEHFTQAQARIETIRQALKGLYNRPSFRSSNRQPDDTNDLFLGRYIARAELGAKNTDKMYLYYSRQNDMAFAVFDWIRVTLNMDKEDLWKFFFELTEINHRMLDDNNKFSYAWSDGESSPLKWQVNRSSTVLRRPLDQRYPLAETLSKKTIQPDTL